MTDDERVAEAERIYLKVRENLDGIERAGMDEQMASKEAGNRPAYYAHDLFGAARRGQTAEHRGMASDLLYKIFSDLQTPITIGGTHPRSPRLIYTTALRRLHEAAMMTGLTPDDIKEIEGSAWARTDAGSLENMYDEYGKKDV